MTEENGLELYKKYRPDSFKGVLGQDEVIGSIVDLGRRKAIPHTMLFSGPSGCGKTTIARILRSKLGCSDADYNEINAAETRGIDTIRDIQVRMGLAPMGGECRFWTLDEVHRLTGDAMSALLKTLEDTPRHVYFALCTTDPQKLLPTIITRSTHFKLTPLKQKDLQQLVDSVCEKEGQKLDEEVNDKLIEAADGSARQALVLLHQIIGIADSARQMSIILKADVRRDAIEIARTLLKPGTAWPEVARILKGIEDLANQAETIRWMVLGYMNSVMVGSPQKASHACLVMSCFRDNFYDSKAAGLTLACYEALSNRAGG